MTTALLRTPWGNAREPLTAHLQARQKNLEGVAKAKSNLFLRRRRRYGMFRAIFKREMRLTLEYLCMNSMELKERRHW